MGSSILCGYIEFWPGSVQLPLIGESCCLSLGLRLLVERISPFGTVGHLILKASQFGIDAWCEGLFYLL
jgi:hypothetical protein